VKSSHWIIVFLFTLAIIIYPNPVNFKGGQSVTFECTVSSSSDATLYLYDSAARLIWQSFFPLAGGAASQISWNGYGLSNLQTGNGLYLIRLLDTSHNLIGKGKLWVVNQ
jgi:hypothetical protein